MPKDHFQKPLTNEQKINNLNMHVNQLYKIIDDVNSRLISLSRSKLGYKEMATFLRDAAANKAYMVNLNSELEYLAKQESAKQNEALKAFQVAPEENTNANKSTDNGSGVGTVVSPPGQPGEA